MNRDRHFDALSDQIILHGVLDLFDASTHIDHNLVGLRKVVVCYIIDILVVSDPIAHLFHLQSTVINHIFDFWCATLHIFEGF